MFPDLSNPAVKKQLNALALLPVSQEAERLLALAANPRSPEHPAVVDLLAWAVEAAPGLGLDAQEAERLLQDVMMALLADKPRMAAKLLLQDLEATPMELVRAETPEQAVKAVLALAQQALV